MQKYRVDFHDGASYVVAACSHEDAAERVITTPGDHFIRVTGPDAVRIFTVEAPITCEFFLRSLWTFGANICW